MTEMDARSRRWATTHQRIYDVALALFQQNGYEQVSVSQIVAGAGVSAPTFYAHYPSKEHVIMQLPTAEEMSALLSSQPAHLPVSERIRRAAPEMMSDWSAEYREAQLARWRIIATTPSLRTQAAAFERITAGMVADALPATPGAPLSPADQIVVYAHLAAFTAGMLAWADGNGERKLEETIDEAFDALQRMHPPAH